MPASYRIDVHAGVVFTVLEGHVTNEVLLGHQQRLSADPDFRPTMNHFIDARGVTEVAVTAFGIRLLTSHSNLAPRSRRAIVEGDATPSYAYLRMFQTLRRQGGGDTRIFSKVDEALRWLGLDCPGGDS